MQFLLFHSITINHSKTRYFVCTSNNTDHRSINRRKAKTKKRLAVKPDARYSKKEPHSHAVLELLSWSGRRDSNSRPLVPETSALPNCATPRHFSSLLISNECNYKAFLCFCQHLFKIFIPE